MAPGLDPHHLAQLEESIRRIGETTMKTNGSIAEVSSFSGMPTPATDNTQPNRSRKLPLDLARALMAPLPKDALQPHPTKE